MQESRDETPWKQITLFLLTLGTLILCALILYPFFSAIVGAIVLAIIAQRPYDWLAARIKNRTACATLAVLLLTLALIVPGYFLAQDIGQQALRTIATLRLESTQDRVTDYIANRPSLASNIESFSASIDANNVAHSTAVFLGSKLATFLGNSVHLITELVVMLFLLFFLFRDRRLAIASLHTLLPLRESETDELLQRVGDTIFASALGRLTIAGVQGLLAGLAFWVLGVPGVILWSLTLMAFAMIPAFGAFLVWGPIAIYLGLNGHWGRAALLAIWGGLIVSTIDNILYPILIGSRLRTHTATILISILGGIALFGVTGIILGPVLFTIASTLLEFWRTRTSPPSSKSPPYNDLSPEVESGTK
jgi:predicted PurR-regulated permease PerM